MALTRRSFITGGAHTTYIGKGHPDFIWKRHPDFGKKENPNIEELLKQAVDGAIADTGVNPEEVDRLYLGNFCGELFCEFTSRSVEGSFTIWIVASRARYFNRFVVGY